MTKNREGEEQRPVIATPFEFMTRYFLYLGKKLDRTQTESAIMLSNVLSENVGDLSAQLLDNLANVDRVRMIEGRSALYYAPNGELAYFRLKLSYSCGVADPRAAGRMWWITSSETWEIVKAHYRDAERVVSLRFLELVPKEDLIWVTEDIRLRNNRDWLLPIVEQAKRDGRRLREMKITPMTEYVFTMGEDVHAD